jgi:alpha-1,2-glucosyltransferase
VLILFSYAFAVLFSKAWFNCECQVFDLRLFNIMALLVSMAYACDCRTLITRIWTRDPAAPLANSELKFWVISNWLKDMSYETLHTAINIALFPPLFFFSGLFYTDILSTCLVLRAYRLFLERKGAYKNSSEGLTTLYLTGMIALTMRQTNIFWVAIFLGGLELVRIIKPQVPSENSGEQVSHSWQKAIVSRFGDYTRGQIHDMPLRDAGLLGTFWLNV